MKITVTEEDIQKGCSVTWADPIALAIKRELGRHVTSVSSTVDRLSFRYRGVSVSVRNPANVSSWLFRFDNDMPVGPIDIDLPIDHLS